MLDERPDLSPEQAAVVRALTTSGDRVQVLRAAASTGKTFTLDAARQALTRSDVTPSAALCRSATTASLRDRRRRRHPRLADCLGAVELREVRRERHDWDRAALDALRDGDVERVARSY